MFVDKNITNEQNFDFLSFLIMFLSFPPFSISSLSFFLLFNRNQDLFFHCFFFYHNLSLFITFILIRYYFLSYFVSLSCLIKFFQSFVFANFCLSFIHLKYRSLFCFTLLILRFPFLKVDISFLLYSILLNYAVVLKERFGQTCMTKEQSEPPLCYIGRCCTGAYVTYKR